MTGGSLPTDRVLVRTLRLAAMTTCSIVGLILVFLVSESWPAVQRLGPTRFLTDPGWLPREGSLDGQFSLVPMAVASGVTTLGAVLLAGPLGILSAVFLCHFAPRRLAFAHERLIEVLAGIPSVVFGFWGLVTLVPLVRRIQPPGPSLFAGILVLTVMILPTVSVLATATLRQVPRSHLVGAAALGLSRWTTIRGVIWPCARRGLGVAVLLGTLRAMGETMAVMMVAGNVAEVPTGLFRPARTLTANIALELGYATEAHRSVLFVSGLVLMVLVLGLVLLQNRLARPVARA